jgi:hypothetical protein
VFFRRKQSELVEDAFISFHFWLTIEEIEQLEAIARQHQLDPAAVVQRIVKDTLKEWREHPSEEN